jgi:hypothetical protein
LRLRRHRERDQGKGEYAASAADEAQHREASSSRSFRRRRRLLANDPSTPAVPREGRSRDGAGQTAGTVIRR